MFYAKSIYLGGVIIRADEVDYNDYQKLGLRCLNCGEEVLLKHGDNKSPHFAHFKLYKTNKNSQEICVLRSSSYNLHCWRELTIEGKNQRKILFQQFFIDIISNTYHDFKYDVLINKNEAIYEDLVNDYIKEFKHHKKELISELNTLPDNVFTNKDDLELQKLILAEVIDYLTLPYTASILLRIINFILYNQKNMEKEKIIFNIFVFLFKVDWVYHLSMYSGEKRRSISISSDKKTNKITNTPLIFNEKKLNIYIKIGVSKYSANQKSSFLDNSFNDYKFSIEPDLTIIIYEDFYRSRKLPPICKRSQKIAEILKIDESISNVSKNKKVLNIYWKINKLYEKKYLHYSVQKLIFVENQVEEFLSKLFLSNFELNFLIQESEDIRQNKLLYFQKIQDQRKQIEDQRKQKQEIYDEQITLKKIQLEIEYDRNRRLNQEKNRLSFVLAEIIRQKILSISYISKSDLFEELNDYIQIIKTDYNSEFINNRLVKCPLCLKNINLNKKNHFTKCSVLNGAGVFWVMPTQMEIRTRD